MTTTAANTVRTIIATAIGAALGVFVAGAISDYAAAQQMDGNNCNWAYTKRVQHRMNGVCYESGRDTPHKASEPGHRDLIDGGVDGLIDRARRAVERATD